MRVFQKHQRVILRIYNPAILEHLHLRGEDLTLFFRDQPQHVHIKEINAAVGAPAHDVLRFPEIQAKQRAANTNSFEIVATLIIPKPESAILAPANEPSFLLIKLDCSNEIAMPNKVLTNIIP